LLGLDFHARRKSQAWRHPCGRFPKERGPPAFRVRDGAALSEAPTPEKGERQASRRQARLL